MINNDDLDYSREYLILDDAEGIYFDSYIDSYKFDEALENTIEDSVYGIGMDDYLLSKGGFTGSEFKKFAKEFDFLFLTGKFNQKDSIIKAFDYLIDFYKYYDIYLYNKGKAYPIDGDNFLDKVSNIILNSNQKYDDFKLRNKYLVDFINYYNERKEKLVLKKEGVN